MHNDQPWTVLRRREVHTTPWRTLVEERVRTHAGDEIDYSYLEAPDAVFVVPVTAAGTVVLLRQYRHPYRAWVWEVPAGGVVGAAPAEIARRELAEEVGGECERLEEVGSFLSCTGHLRLRSHVFLATGVRLGERSLEPTELLEAVEVPFEEAVARARRGEIDDGESALALLMCETRAREYLAGPR